MKDHSENMNAVPNTPCKDSWNAAKDAVVPEKFMGCLNSFLTTAGARYKDSINMNADKTKITSSK